MWWKIALGIKVVNWLHRKLKKNMFKKPERYVAKVYLHHTASSNPEHDNVDWLAKVHVLENRWDDIGYHYFIDSKGKLFKCRDLEKIPAAQFGHNAGSIAICLSGIEDSFTKDQFNTLKKLCKAIDKAYDGAITFHGHKEVYPTRCPEYDYISVLNLNRNGYLIT